MATRKRNTGGKFIIAILVIAVIILAGLAFVNNRQRQSDYLTSTVTKNTIETYYTFSGSVESKNFQNVMAEKIMQISKIKVKEGTKVKKDDVLFVTSDDLEVKAKIAGTISKIYVEADQQVMAGELLCDIYDFNNLQISIKVDEYELSCVSEDKEITVTINALEKDIIGTVSSISDVAVNQNGIGYFIATVDLEKDQDIKIGMSAEAKILNKESKDTLTIPMEALQFDENNNPFTLVKGEGNTTIRTSVTVGINDGKIVEILSGLQSGQVVCYNKVTNYYENFGRRGNY